MNFRRNKFYYSLKKGFGSAKYIRKYNYSFQSVDIPYDPIVVLCTARTKDDPMLVAMSFSRHLYFTADESFLTNGGEKKSLRYKYSPIPIFSASNNTEACLEIIRRVKAGHSICIFPEGKRSGDGTTGEIKKSVAELLKRLCVCVVTYKIDGAYMINPAWAKHMRRGKTYGHTVNIYSPENVKRMSVERLYEAIVSDLSEDAIASVRETQSVYKGENLAEGIENQLCICPACKRLNTLSSKGNSIICECHAGGEIDADGRITGFPFDNVRDWTRWQLSMIESLPFMSEEKELAFNENCELYEIRRDHSSELVCKGRLSASNVSFKISSFEVIFDKILRADVNFDGNLTFATKKAGRSHYEIRCEGGYCAQMYLDILKRYKSSK